MIMTVLLVMLVGLAQAPTERAPTWLSSLANEAKSGGEFLNALAKSGDLQKLIAESKVDPNPAHGVVRRLGELQHQTFKTNIGGEQKSGPVAKAFTVEASAREIAERLTADAK